MYPLLLSLPQESQLALQLAQVLKMEFGQYKIHHFPDRETYIRIVSSCQGRDVIIVCSLDQPDDKLIPLLFLAQTAKDLGATDIGLVAPYLAYMRKNRQFKEGEGVTSRYFAEILSKHFNWLVTVDPHLHRYSSLNEYEIPSSIVHAAQAVSRWVKNNIDRPVLVGSDSESEQWVAVVASRIGAPHIVLSKTRRGDREVEISVPDVEEFQHHTPVLVDDIISSVHTMIETVRLLKKAGMPAPVCIGVHGIFAENAELKLLEAGAAYVFTCNTIENSSNAVDLTSDIAKAIQSHLRIRL